LDISPKFEVYASKQWGVSMIAHLISVRHRETISIDASFETTLTMGNQMTINHPKSSKRGSKCREDQTQGSRRRNQTRSVGNGIERGTEQAKHSYFLSIPPMTQQKMEELED
jgi:hypothetical protein